MAAAHIPPLPAASVDLNAIHDALASGASVTDARDAGLGKAPPPSTPKPKAKPAPSDAPPSTGE